jgi:hypothetical protein
LFFHIFDFPKQYTVQATNLSLHFLFLFICDLLYRIFFREITSNGFERRGGKFNVLFKISEKA